MSLAMDLAALCDMWRWNGINGCHLASFSIDVTFASRFVATFPPYRSASGKQVDILISKNQALQIIYFKHHVYETS